MHLGAIVRLRGCQGDVESGQIGFHCRRSGAGDVGGVPLGAGGSGGRGSSEAGSAGSARGLRFAWSLSSLDDGNTGACPFDAGASGVASLWGK
jgi:hypothetical protein